MMQTGCQLLRFKKGSRRDVDYMRPSNAGLGPLRALPIPQCEHRAWRTLGIMDQSFRHASKWKKMRSRPLARVCWHIFCTKSVSYTSFLLPRPNGRKWPNFEI